MVIKYRDKEITTLEDIQKLKVKELRDILKCNSERAGGTKADLVLKVYALLVRNVVRPAENVEENADNSGHFEYEETLRISALGWSTDLRQLAELNFIQLYDYLVVSTRKYRHIVLKGTNYKKLKSYQFFFEGNARLKITDSRSPVMMTGQIFFSPHKPRFWPVKLTNNIIFFVYVISNCAGSRSLYCIDVKVFGNKLVKNSFTRC